MRILIVSPFENTATGRGDRNINLTKALRARGHDVTVVTGNFDHGKKVHIPKSLLDSGPGLRVIKLPGYKTNIGIRRIFCHLVFALKMWFWGIRKKWDVVVVSSIPPESLFSATLLRKRSLVVDIRDIWPDALQAYNKQSIITHAFSIYCDTIFRLTLRHADRIMVVAPGFRSWLARYTSLSSVRVKFVPVGFRREDFRPISGGGFRYAFCYAGGATPQFDIHEFSALFGSENGIVIGDGPLIEMWKTSFPNAEFPGAIPREEAMALMAQSRRLLFPSNPYAQLPNKAFDYFALGYPVVLGEHCSRATRSLLSLRRRRLAKREGVDAWTDYKVLEKEAIAKRAANIVEEVGR